MNEKELHTNIRSALQSLTSNSPPSTIQQAQDALLQWEEQYTDDYVLVLLDLMGITSNETTSTKTTDAATLRLASILSLKATIVRRWKDRGRGKGPGGTPKPLMSENVKTLVRSQILSLVLTGRVATHDSSVGTVMPFSGIEHIRHITLGQYEILSDHTLQMNAASLLAKIARMDLPLKFHDLIPTLVEGVKSSQSMISQLSQQHSDPSTHYELSQQRGLCLTIQQNAMTSLECVLAEISTQRLLVDKKYRYATAMQHLGRIVESGLIPSLAAMDSMKNELGRIDGMDKKEVQSIIFRINHAILSSRVVSHMLISSFSKLIEQNSLSSNVVDHTLTLIHTFLTQWLPFVTQNASNDVNTNSEIVAIKKLIKDLLHVLCELIVELQSSSPIPFVRYLDPFLSLFYSSLLESIWINHEEISFTAGRTYQMYQSKRILISSLLFLANVAETKQYTDICTDHNAATIVWKKFFTPNTILSLSRNLLVLISAHISPNKNTDNNDDDDEEGVLWQDDPEGFYQWENQRSTDEHVGCAAQNLFLALAEASFECEDGLQSPDGFHGGKDVILPWLVGLLTDLPSQRLAVELEAGIANANVQSLVSAMPLGASNSQGQLDTIKSDLILQWDAVYTVAGLACNYLTSFPGYDFNECFESLLGPLLVLLIKSENTTNHLLPILRRRIIWLISCNAHQVPVPSCHNPLELISISLSHNDICVRLTAVEAMEAILPYCEDSPKLLHSITHSSIAALYQLTNDCLEVDSRSSCLGLLSTLISFVGVLGGSLSNDVLNTVVSPLPSIWEDSIEQNLLLKRNVLNIISSVATLVGPDQASLLYPIALPMLDQSFGKEENIFLVQEALRMWLVFLRLSNGYNGSIGMLFTRAANLSKDLEHVIILMRISEYYIMLGGATFLNDHAQTIQEVLCNLVGEVRPRGLAYVGLVIEALLRSYPVESGSLLFQCGLVKRFSEACAGNYWEKDDCEPDRVIVLYLTALARILLSNLGMLSKILPVVSSFGEVFGEEQLVSMYISKFRAAGNGAHGLLFQKLWAILLASFFPPCEVSSVITNCVLSRSKEIFDGIFAYILRNVNADGSNLLSYDVGYDGEEEDIIDTGADRYELLLQEASKKDAIVAVPFKDFLESKLRSLPNSLGHEAYQQFLQMIGNDTMAELETLMGNR